MAEKKRNWDEWIGGMTGALGASAIRKVQTDARNEAKAASYPERKTTYSRTPQEIEAIKQRFATALKEGNVGKLKPIEKSGSIGRESAEKARDNRRQYEEWKKKRK